MNTYKIIVSENYRRGVFNKTVKKWISFITGEEIPQTKIVICDQVLCERFLSSLIHFSLVSRLKGNRRLSRRHGVLLASKSC